MAVSKKKLPKYGRVSEPPSMRLTERDKHILEAVHAYDGMMGFSQIHRKFFSSKSQAELRLRLLYQNHYLNRPDAVQRRKMSEMIYWLDKSGAALVASLNGIEFKDFTWRQQPRWFQVEHDLAVNDFRIDLEQACQDDPAIDLEMWTPEGEFLAYPDEVQYTYQGKKLKRNIRPDGFFMLQAGNHRIRYLLEIDRSTEDNPRFFREKILPGLAYLKSNSYEERFGHKSGRWVVVTTGQRRMVNMLRQAEQAKVKGLFYFTTFDKVSPETLLQSPVWRREDRDESVPLVFLD